MKYRKKPVEIEAFRLTDDAEMIAPAWFTDARLRLWKVGCRQD